MSRNNFSIFNRQKRKCDQIYLSQVCCQEVRRGAVDEECRLLLLPLLPFVFGRKFLFVRTSESFTALHLIGGQVQLVQTLVLQDHQSQHVNHMCQFLSCLFNGGPKVPNKEIKLNHH